MLLEMKESFASGRLPVDYVVNHKRGIEEDEKFSPLALKLEEIYSLPPVFFTARQQKMYRYRLVAQLFEKKALHLKENKASLIKKFPLQFDLPGKKEEKKWCKLCLGSKLYNEIYDEPCNDEVEAYHPLGLSSNPGEDMDVCKCIGPSRHGGTLNSRRAASPLVRLVEGKERWEAPDHSQGVFLLNWGGNEPKIVLSPVWCSKLQLTTGVTLP
ncbi:uncharacterized protein TNCV_1586941 [Trichonephila clavipes]|nr:uncharacterized protein TNCV_1586941 [Trichonephila clavipes]